MRIDSLYKINARAYYYKILTIYEKYWLDKYISNNATIQNMKSREI